MVATMAAAPVGNTVSSGSAVGMEQYLTFTLGREVYGINILDVQEIRGYSAVTPLPHAPAYVAGIMNLRGAVVPVVDLRQRFGLMANEYDRFTVIVVVRVAGKVTGLVVDSVSDVLDVLPTDLRPVPEVGVQANAQFVKGIVARGNESADLVILLHLERLVGEDLVAE